MDPTNETKATPSPDAEKPLSIVDRTVVSIRGKILGGLLFVLPIVITFWIIVWMYRTVDANVIDPVAKLIHRAITGTTESEDPNGAPAGGDAIGPNLPEVTLANETVTVPPWFDDYVAPFTALCLVVGLLYVTGIFVHAKLLRVVDFVLLRVPVVTVIYGAVRNVFQSMERQREGQQFQRVVLVAFPHPGMRVPGFVTSTCRDAETGKTILCVYIPTTPVPTSGYMLLVPEEEVTQLDWNLDETLQAIVSGGISVPPEVRYFSAQKG